MIRTSFLFITFAMTFSPLPGHAQSKTEMAEALFQDGRALLKADQIQEACAAFAASQKLEPRTSTLLNLASCHEQDQQLATAWEEFSRAQTMAEKDKDKKFLDVATQHANRLRPLVSRLTLEVNDPDRILGLQLHLKDELRGDEERIEPLTWNHALPIDGGVYTLRVTAPRHAPWIYTVKIEAQSDARTIRVPLLSEADQLVAIALPKPAANPRAGASRPTPPAQDSPTATPILLPQPSQRTTTELSASPPSQQSSPRIELSVGYSQSHGWSDYSITHSYSNQGVFVNAAFYPVRQLALVVEAWQQWSSFETLFYDGFDERFYEWSEEWLLLTGGVRVPLPHAFSLQMTGGAVRHTLDYEHGLWSPALAGSAAWRIPIGPFDLGLELRASTFLKESIRTTTFGVGAMMSKRW